jgi:hypothetical protein
MDTEDAESPRIRGPEALRNLRFWVVQGGQRRAHDADGGRRFDLAPRIER